MSDQPSDAPSTVETTVAPAVDGSSDVAHEPETASEQPTGDSEQAQRQKNLAELVARLSSTRALREPEDAATDEQKAGAASYSPSETELDDLSMYIIRIRTDYSVPQLLARLKQMRSHWSISEKRVRKSVQRVRPRVQAEEDEQSQAITGHVDGQSNGGPKPVSKNDKHIAARLKDAAPLLEIKRHGDRGRGLFLRMDADDVAEDTILLTEDAYVYAPSENWTERIVEGNACAQCGKSLTGRRLDILRCQQHPASRSSKPLTVKQKQAKEARETAPTCEIRYCSKPCQESSAKHYGKLVCPTLNPEWIQLLEASVRIVRAPHQVFKIWARLISAARRSEKEARDELNIIEGLTAMPETERRPELCVSRPGSSDAHRASQESVRNVWKQCHEAVIKALHIFPAKAADESVSATEDANPAGDSDVENKPVNGETKAAAAPAKPTQDRLYQPAPEWLAKALGDFSYDSFLLWWGRTALNNEDDGGIFPCHAALNHSCAPNARLDRSAAKRGSPGFAAEARPGRVYIKALRPIAKGEEITIPYVNPADPFQQRHQNLKQNFCFECLCDRCEGELRSLSQRLVDGESASNGPMVFNLNGDEDQSEVIRRIIEQANASNAGKESATLEEIEA